MPSGLSGRARDIWTELAPRCLDMGTLTVADGRSFGLLCELLATQELAQKEKDRDGFAPFVLETTVDGAGNEHVKQQEHKALVLERRTASAVKPYLQMFRLEPGSRVTMQPRKTERDKKSKWDGLLTGAATSGTTAKAH